MRRLLGLLAVAVLSAGSWATAPANAARPAAPMAGHCPVWHEKTIAYSLGILESLLPDNHGGMLLSSTTHNAIERLAPSGKIKTLAHASSPGQLVWRGKQVMFPTGDDFADGASSATDGTLQLLNLRTKKLRTYATGLTMPNGLVIGGDGSAYVTRDTGSGTGITRISAEAPHGAHSKPRITTNWARVSDTNGIAINRRTRTMYVDQTFTTGGPIWAVPMHRPSTAHKVADLGATGSAPIKGLDDLTMSPSGVLYLPANVGGELLSFDPKTGQKCLIGSGLGNPSDVTIGTGHGWRKGALFVCGFNGSVSEFYR